MSRWSSLRQRFEEMDEEFFRDLFRKPAEVEYDYHPSERVLRAYLSGELRDEWHFDREFLPKLRRADLNGDWGLSEVSLHLLTCSHCAARVAQLRAEEAQALALEKEEGVSLLSRLQALVRSWLKPSPGLGEPWGREWPAEQPIGVGILGFLPLAPDLLPTRGAIFSSVSLGLFHRRLGGAPRSGR
ncbi:MAG: hypothetical protein ACUVRH_00565 [Candidatus Bipolaricaulia bacterium]